MGRPKKATNRSQSPQIKTLLEQFGRGGVPSAALVKEGIKQLLNYGVKN